MEEFIKVENEYHYMGKCIQQCAFLYLYIKKLSLK